MKTEGSELNIYGNLSELTSASGHELIRKCVEE